MSRIQLVRRVLLPYIVFLSVWALAMGSAAAWAGLWAAEEAGGSG